MKAFLSCMALLLSIISYAQKPAADTWSNVPTAGDDRFTNPKSAVYAGPNGWWNFGEVRAEGTTNATVKYGFKGGINENSEIFNLAESGKLLVLSMDFGTSEPAPGTYEIGKEASQAQNKVAVSFGDVANKKIKNWSNGTGTVIVSKSNGFLYFKCRNAILQPSGVYNEGNDKQPLKVGFEGAAKM